MLVKLCTVCGIIKPLDRFYRAAGGLFGHTSQCKPCRYLLYERPKKHTKVCRVCGKRRVHHRPKWCLRCDAAKAKAWRERNHEWHKENMRAWRKGHPEVSRKSYVKRKAWLRRGNATKVQLQILYGQSNGKCKYCGMRVMNPRFRRTDPRGFDHIIPRIRGGKHTITNMVVCCWGCNAWKSGDSQDAIGNRVTVSRMPTRTRR